MGIIRQHTLLDTAMAAATGDWVALDTRFEDVGNTRTIQVELTTGDTVIVEGTTLDEKGIDKTFLDDLTAQDISTIGTYTANDIVSLAGTWSYIRARKTGTTGPARVQGHI